MHAAYGTPRVPTPTSRVELSLSAKNLKDRDIISKSDPFAVLFVLEGQHWIEIGRTESLKDNLSPTWTKLFLVDYYFELQQQLKVDIYDKDSSAKKLSEHDYIGGAAFSLGQLMGAPGQSGSFLLKRGKHQGSHRGSLLVKAEEAKNTSEAVRLRFSGSSLANMDGMFSKSDPYLVIKRLREDNSSWIAVHKTETIDNNLNPNWKVFELSMQQLCNGDHRRPLQLQVFDQDRGGKHQLIGSVDTCVEELAAKRGRNFILHNEELHRKKGKKYTNAGLLIAHEVQIIQLHSFVEYLRGGLEMSLVLGIDYTASNGAPTDPRSLHFLDPRGPNQYQHAISTTASILQEYDSDKMIPVYGFGGIPPGAHSVDHCFPLNLNPSNPEVFGVQGVLQLYTSSLAHIRLHGPTCFAPIIHQTMAIALSSADPRKQKYFVLLIITDGAIMDMPATINALVQAANTTPLSIVIIGVGPADFSSMNALDGDGKVLRDTHGRVSTRDIVQFVPYNRFANNPLALTRVTLAEIPNQLCQYMRVRGINPNPLIPPSFKAFDQPGGGEQFVGESVTPAPIGGVDGVAPAATPGVPPQQGAPAGYQAPPVHGQEAAAQDPNVPHAQIPPQQGQQPPQGSPPQQGQQPPQGYPPQQGQQPPQGYPPQQGQQPPQGYPKQGQQPPQGYPGYGQQPPQGYPPQGQYDYKGYPPQGGYAPQGYPAQPGYPPQGNPGLGYAPQGYAPQGYAPQGYAPQGYPPQRYPQQGYPPQGYPQQQQPAP